MAELQPKDDILTVFLQYNQSFPSRMPPLPP